MSDAARSAARSAPRRAKGKAVQDSLPNQVYRLLTFHSAPEYLRDNKYVFTGYRADTTFFQAFLSIFRLHNETGNIWSHLLGFMVFLALTIVVAKSEVWELTTRVFHTARHAHVRRNKKHVHIASVSTLFFIP